MQVPFIKTDFSTAAWLKGVHYRDSFNQLTRDWERARNYNRGELYSVFDGIGSSKDYSVVQKMALHLKRFYTTGQHFSPDWIGVQSLLKQGNDMICDAVNSPGSEEHHGGCCGIVAYVLQSKLYLFQTGHCHAVIIRNREIIFKTWIEKFTPNHNDAYFGGGDRFHLNLIKISLKPEDKIYLFTQSVLEKTSEDDFLRDSSHYLAAPYLVFRAKQLGAKDDVTAATIDMNEFWI